MSTNSIICIIAFVLATVGYALAVLGDDGWQTAGCGLMILTAAGMLVIGIFFPELLGWEESALSAFVA